MHISPNTSGFVVVFHVFFFFPLNSLLIDQEEICAGIFFLLIHSKPACTFAWIFHSLS